MGSATGASAAGAVCPCLNDTFGPPGGGVRQVFIVRWVTTFRHDLGRLEPFGGEDHVVEY